MASRGRRLPRIIAAVAVGGLLASACASTGYHYVKNSEDRNYFKVPDEWKLFDEDAVIRGLDLSPREADVERETAWRVAFDGSPKPVLEHLDQLFPKHPVGRALVVGLDQESSDTISIGGMRNLFFDIDGAIQQDTGTLIFYEPIELDGGFRGVHLVAEINDPESGRTLVFNQKAVLDQSTSNLYALVISCEATCYDKSESKIDQIVDSWTVEE